ncbi:hypothetical protein H6F96_20250 [Microcoleus sp. FACHB-53]|nr:hypothetical protein [Microcoleus sp. FACHB-53]MBD2129197.1 hypothetical protein [Microcoleus sp. FACHB-1]
MSVTTFCEQEEMGQIRDLAETHAVKEAYGVLSAPYFIHSQQSSFPRSCWLS